VRLLLILTLINGLAPSLGELAETAVHLAVEGHLAHSQAAHCGQGERGDEHGCGTTEHHCTCCASQVVVSTQASEFSVSLAVAPRHSVTPDALVSLHEPTPPFRPPILS
jgi:hypothetical protein